MPNVPGGGLVRLPGEARLIDVGAFDVAVLAERDEAGGAFSLIETAESSAGTGPPLHVHRDAAESFYVLEGAYDMTLEDETFRCPVGSFVYVPKAMTHTFRSALAGSRKLNLYTPSAMVGYFDELAHAIASGTDAAGLDEIAERYAMDVVGPVPEGYL